MLIYALICLSLSLAGVAGLQFFYMLYLEGISKEHKKRIRELEKHCVGISKRLKDAEGRIHDQKEFSKSAPDEEPGDETIWADVIEDA